MSRVGFRSIPPAVLICILFYYTAVVSQLGPVFDDDPPPPGIESKLYRYYQYIVQGETALSKQAVRRFRLREGEGLVTVVIEPVGSPSEVPDEIIEGRGGRVLARSRTLLRVALPPDQLVKVGAEQAVRLVRTPYRAYENAIEGEGVKITGADVLHMEGITGLGAKVAIIDSGFEGLDEASSRGDAPGNWRFIDFSGDGLQSGSEHGTAVLEIAYEMAPDAEYYLMKDTDFVGFENAVQRAIDEGIHVINYSKFWIGFGFGDGLGPACDLVDHAVESGAVWVNAAGNHAERVYTAFYADTDGDGWHNVEGEGELVELRDLSNGHDIDVWLTWNDWPLSSQNYDLALTEIANDGTVEIVEWANTVQDGGGTPVEHIVYQPKQDTRYAVAVIKQLGARSELIKLESANHRLKEGATIVGTIVVPADSREAIAVGAIEYGLLFSSIADYSSQGPTVDGRIKPDISAPAGVASFSYPAGFDGTSAAAPHVSGAAALLKSADPEFYTADRIRDVLIQSADDRGDRGKDNVYGWGALSLDNLNLRQALPAVFVGTTSIDLGELFLGDVQTSRFFVTNTGRGVLGVEALFTDSADWILSYSEPAAHLYLFEDDSETDSWGRSSRGTDELQNGRLVLGGDDSGFLLTFGPQLTIDGDQDIQVSTEWLSGVTNHAYGLMFLSNDAGNYRFIVSGNGNYHVSLDNGEELITLQDWTDGATAQGVNRFRVRRAGSSIQCFLNDQHMTTLDDATHSSGRVRLIVGGEQQVAFDRLVIAETKLTRASQLSPGDRMEVFATALATGEGQTEATLSVNTSDPNNPRIDVPLSASVSIAPRLPAIALSISSMDFGEVISGSRGERTLTVRNEGSADLVIDGISVDGTGISVVPQSSVIPPGGSRSFVVVFSPTQAGDFVGIVTVNSNAGPQPVLTIRASVMSGVTRNALVDIETGSSGDGAYGGSRSATISGPGEQVSLEVFVTPPPEGTLGGEFVLDYDRNRLRIASVETPDGFFVLGDTDSSIAVVALLRSDLPENGYLATVILESLPGFDSGSTEVAVESLHLEFVPVSVPNTALLVALSAPQIVGDFDGDGSVGFSDFILFAGAFGKSLGQAGYEDRFDLDPNSKVDFADFLVFANAFGS